MWGDTGQCSRSALPQLQQCHVLVTSIVSDCRCWKSLLLCCTQLVATAGLHAAVRAHACDLRCTCLQTLDFTITAAAPNELPLLLSKLLSAGIPVTFINLTSFQDNVPNYTVIDQVGMFGITNEVHLSSRSAGSQTCLSCLPLQLTAQAAWCTAFQGLTPATLNSCQVANLERPRPPCCCHLRSDVKVPKPCWVSVSAFLFNRFQQSTSALPYSELLGQLPCFCLFCPASPPCVPLQYATYAAGRSASPATVK